MNSFFSNKFLKQALTLCLSFSLILQQTVSAAGLKVDTTANKQYQATLDKAQNGVDIVNITKANKRGISHNKFFEYNVNKKGLILNNAYSSEVKTKLAGYIFGNKNLQGKSARVILNQVTSTSKSELKGYTEVAGKSASVIVANPNGIMVKGGGFINTNQVRLTTAKPYYNKEKALAYEAQRGTIELLGDPFNVSNVERVELYAKVLKINTKLYAKDLDVKADQIIHQKQGVDLDSSYLGGVYANKISLVATEKGLGVNLPLEIIAQDSLYINSQGNIVLDTVYSKEVSLKAKDTITNNESIIATTKLNLESNRLINKNIIASGLKIEDDVLKVNEAFTHRSYIYTNHLDNLGTIYSKSDLDIAKRDTLAFSSFTNQGEIYSQNNLKITTDTLNNLSWIRALNNVNIKVNTLTNYANISSNNELTIEADYLINYNTIYSGYATYLYIKNRLSNITDKTKVPDIDTATIQAKEKLIIKEQKYQDTSKPRSLIIENDKGTIEVLGKVYTYIDTKTQEEKVGYEGDLEVVAKELNNRGSTTFDYEVSQKNLGDKSNGLTQQELEAKFKSLLKSGKLYVVICKSSCNSYMALGVLKPKFLKAFKSFLPDLLEEHKDDIDSFFLAPNSSISLALFESEIKNNKTTTQYASLLSNNMSLDIDKINNNDGLISARNDLVITSKEGITNQVSKEEVKLNNKDLVIGNSAWKGGKRHQASISKLAIKDSSSKSIIEGSSVIEGKNVTLNAEVKNGEDFKEQYKIGNDNTTEIRTTPFVHKNYNLPTNKYGRFVKSTNTKHNYLIESNPAYTKRGTFISSNYFLSRLKYDADKISKRLGDAQYETKLVRDAIISLTGKRSLYQDLTDNEQYVALMNNAINLQDVLGLQFGESLNKTQRESLTKNIVWMETKVVENQEVLVPVVYLAKDSKKLEGATILAQENLLINSSKNLVNSGTLKAGKDIEIKVNSITNAQGVIYSKGITSLIAENSIINRKDSQITANSVNLFTKKGSVTNNASKISAEESLLIESKKDILNTKGAFITASEVSLNSKEGSIINKRTLNKKRLGELLTYQKDSKQSVIESIKGNLVLKAQNSIKNQASVLKAKGTLSLSTQKGDIELSSISKEIQTNYLNGKNFFKYKRVKNIQSDISAKKDIVLNAGGSVAITASNLVAKNNIEITAKNNINILAVNDIEYKDNQRSSKKSFGRSGLHRDMTHKEEVISSELKAKNIALDSQNNINLEAAILEAKENKKAYAKGNLNIYAKEFTQKELHSKSKSSWGGMIQSEHKLNKEQTKLKSSLITSKNLIVDVKALNLQASKIKADSADITASVINLISGKERYFEDEFSNKGGILTATIENKGRIQEEAVASKIEVKDRIIFNGKDITSKLETDFSTALANESIIKILSSQTDLSIEQINQIKAELKSDSWYTKTTTLSGVGALIVQAIVTYFTAGAGTALVAGITDAAIKAAMQAVVQSVVTQATMSLASSVITGNSLNLDMKSLVKGAVTAGMLSYANNLIDVKMGYKDVSTDAKGFETFKSSDLSYGQELIKTTLHTGVEVGLTGDSFKDTLVNNLVQTTADSAFNYVAHELYAEDSQYKDILPPKTITHAIIGGSLAKLQGGDFTSGAIATVTAHLTAQAMIENYIDDVVTGKMDEEELINRIKMVASLISGVISKVAKPNQSDNDLLISNQIAQSNVDNNSLKLITTAIKIARKLKKIEGKITKDKLRDIGLDEIADIVEDGSTILDPNATLAEKAMAVADLVVGTEFNSKKSKVLRVKTEDNKVNKVKVTSNPKKANAPNQSAQDLIDKIKKENKNKIDKSTETIKTDKRTEQAANIAQKKSDLAKYRIKPGNDKTTRAENVNKLSNQFDKSGQHVKEVKEIIGDIFSDISE